MIHSGHACRTPFDFDGVLRFLSARAIPGVELIRDGTYIRSTKTSEHSRPTIVRISRKSNGHLSASATDLQTDSLVFNRVAHLFDLSHDPQPMIDDLRRVPELAPLVRQHPGIRVPGAWEPFELCVRAIVGQQISVAGARTILGRITARYGEPLDSPAEGITTLFPSPQWLADADLQSVGLTRNRSSTIREAARLFADSGTIPECGRSLDFDLLERLSSIRGIGPWTLGYISMRGSGDPDAYPVGDLVLRKAFGDRPITSRDLDRRAERWRPWRAHATILLWRKAANGACG